jgi:hypothetical protein
VDAIVVNIIRMYRPASDRIVSRIAHGTFASTAQQVYDHARVVASSWWSSWSSC